MLLRIAYYIHFSQSQLHAGSSISTTIYLLSVLSMKEVEIFLFQVSALIIGQLCEIAMNYSVGFLVSDRSALYSGTSSVMNPRS